MMLSIYSKVIFVKVFDIWINRHFLEASTVSNVIAPVFEEICVFMLQCIVEWNVI